MFQIPRELSVVTYLRHSSDWRELWAEMSKAYRMKRYATRKFRQNNFNDLFQSYPASPALTGHHNGG
jgi:hypothetical protein